MLKYLIIQLDDTTIPFCHYNNAKMESRLIPLDVLKEALFWSMKENLNVQLLYPDYELPSVYYEAISKIDHTDIVSSFCEDVKLRNNADVVVFGTLAGINYFPFNTNQAYVIRTALSDLFSLSAFINVMLPRCSRLNIVITNIEDFDKAAEANYSKFLDNLAEKIYLEYKNNHAVQVNILTDRILLEKMNNCNAGVEAITLAPDGKLYICPGFYLDGSDSVGDIKNGLDIKNPQLYHIDHAPICKICDAWQCKRCVWINRKTTLEVNTPSREQCVMAHLERNTSRELLKKIRTIGEFMPEKKIPQIDYLDPFDTIVNQHLS